MRFKVGFRPLKITASGIPSCMQVYTGVSKSVNVVGNDVIHFHIFIQFISSSVGFLPHICVGLLTVPDHLRSRSGHESNFSTSCCLCI